MLESLVFLGVGLLLLLLGADAFIDNAVRLARKWGVSTHVIGVTLVAFATSLPEVLVSLLAGTRGHSDLALGNIVGSNMSNFGLVLASACFLCWYRYGRTIMPAPGVITDSQVMLAFAFLLYGVALDGIVTRGEGALLLLLYFAYVAWLIRRPTDDTAGPESEGSLLRLSLGVTGLLIGAHLTIEGAVSLAVGAGIPELVIGLTVVAVGTSLPELAGSLTAARKGFHDIAVANVIGSNIANIGLVLGMLALVSPVPVAGYVIAQTLPLLLLATIAAMGLVRLPMGRVAGAVLAGFFLLFLFELLQTL